MKNWWSALLKETNAAHAEMNRVNFTNFDSSDRISKSKMCILFILSSVKNCFHRVNSYK